MTDQGDMTPAVWDPTARGGAGGWVRRAATPPRADAAPLTPPPAQPAPAGPPGPPPAGPPPSSAAPVAPSAGAVGDQGPPLAARPYLATALDTPTARPAPPQPPAAPQGGYGYPQQVATGPVRPTGGFPAHLDAPAPGAPPQPYQPYQPAQPPHQQQYPQQHQQQSYPARPPYGAPTQPYQPQPQAPGSYPPAGPIELPDRYHEFDQYQEARPSRRTPLLIGIGVVVLLAIGGGTVLALQNGSGSPKAAAGPSAAPPPAASSPAGGSATPSSTATGSADPSSSASGSASAGPNAAGEAKALDDLLTRGESAKAPISSAVAKVGSCPAKADIDSAATTFDTAATQRDQLITDLTKLNLADLPGGADAASTLKTAWQQSGDIDRSYAAWARTVSAQGCGAGKTAPSTPDKQHADDLNPQATQSKKDFVDKWNALAGTYGLTARTWDRI